MNVRTALISCGLALALIACGDPYVDTDKTPDTARVVPQDLTVEDDLDAKVGDKLDWKSVVPMIDGEATIVVRVGDAFKGTHDVKGEIVVFDLDAREQTRARIEPNVLKYDLTWSAKADTTYLVKVMATAGKAKYSVDYSLKPADPCATVRCGAGTECQAGTCVAIELPEVDCIPECSRGTFCVDGKCQKACADGCGRGETCDTELNECVADPCHGKKCARGEYCSKGRCYTKRKRGCDPPCGSGEKCRGNRCVTIDPGTPDPPETDDGPIVARIIQATPAGSKTSIILNKGSKHGVKAGQTGSVKGVGSFKVTQVFSTRCKAIIGVAHTALGGAKTAVIRR